MVIINAAFTKGNMGTKKGKYEWKNVTRIRFDGIRWEHLTRQMIKQHPIVSPLIADGWKLQGYALVREAV